MTINYGKILRLLFDGKIYNVTSVEKARFRIKNAYGEYMYPINVTYGANDHEIYLHFSNMNNLIFPVQFECLGTIKMGSELVCFGEFALEIWPQGLCPVPGDAAYLSLDSVAVSGNIDIAFDGKMYLNDGYLGLSSVSVAGTVITLSFYKRYLYDGYLGLSAVSVAGTYCDVNGNPL